jgi:hypothetical protein
VDCVKRRPVSLSRQDLAVFDRQLEFYSVTQNGVRVLDVILRYMYQERWCIIPQLNDSLSAREMILNFK